MITIVMFISTFEFSALLCGVLGLVVVCVSYYSSTQCRGKEGFFGGLDSLFGGATSGSRGNGGTTQCGANTSAGANAANAASVPPVAAQTFSNYDRESRAYQQSLDKQVERIASAQTKVMNPATQQTVPASNFETVDRRNPLGNVLLTQIYDNPHRKEAPPSFNPDVEESINSKTKRMIQTLNPGIHSTNKQLYGSIGENFEFEQSQRQFYSTANTRVENDQGAFADWLYGGMISSKEAHPQALMQNNGRYNLY